MSYKDNHKFYLRSFKAHGFKPKGVRWSTKKSQFLRFEVLINYIKENALTSSVVDAGCGFGDLYLYLLENDISFNNYLGIDCEDFMIESAAKRFEGASFKKKNILVGDLNKADYYVCSGAMNILNEEEIIAFITNCFEASKKGFVFNFYKNLSFNDLDEGDLLRFCATLTDKLQITRDYIDDDFTIFMVK